MSKSSQINLDFTPGEQTRYSSLTHWLFTQRTHWDPGTVYHRWEPSLCWQGEQIKSPRDAFLNLYMWRYLFVPSSPKYIRKKKIQRDGSVWQLPMYCQLVILTVHVDKSPHSSRWNDQSWRPRGSWGASTQREEGKPCLKTKGLWGHLFVPPCPLVKGNRKHQQFFKKAGRRRTQVLREWSFSHSVA